MTYYASLGELLLIACLLFTAHRCFHSPNQLSLRLGICLALLFVAVTASFGVVRFAGNDSVIGIHDVTSWLSTNIAMPMYATLTAMLFVLNKKITIALVALFTTSVFLSLFGVTLLTNAVLFVALVAIAYFSDYRGQTVKALIAILLVPLTALLPVSYDLQMGIFHLLLACHFYLISEVYQNKTS